MQPGPQEVSNQYLIKRNKRTSIFYMYLALTPCRVIYNIGQDLGHLDDYKITKTSARIQVSVDALKPLTKSTILEMDSGEELLPIMLEYEDLGYHYSICNKLSHLAKSCPLAPRPTQDTTLAPSPIQQWREKTLPSLSFNFLTNPLPTTPLNNSASGGELEHPPPPLGRNLAENDYPPDPRIPSRDQVLEELRESTFQYTNVSDPSEAAARKQRVIHSEENGLMEQTADRIIVAASNTLLAINAETDQSNNLQGDSYISGQTSQALPPAAPFSATLGSSRRTHNGTGTSRRTSASPPP
ncbi:hypothetical protein HID58_042973 [Brassica napus]|uniref:Zinc knuckle CX2CX4HX4C domain-containing protein n=1 Tax=Brassica napus TaxID=3708 RepID=A0ABQ8BF48_BRANA|nr:hypothetical protein HID58_042973 [Brassica napus]